MNYEDLFMKKIYIKIINFNINKLYIFIQLNGLFNFLLKIYDSIELFIDNDFNQKKYIEFINIFLNFQDNKNINNSFGEKNKNLINIIYENKIKINNIDHLTNNIIYTKLFKIIDLNNSYNIEDIYNNIFGIPYSISLKYQHFFRNENKENELYLYHINKFNNFSYIFTSSFYHLIDSEFPIFNYKKNIYKDQNHPFHNFWYKNEDNFYLFGKIIENCNELYIYIQDSDFLELSLILNLHKIKKKYIYYKNHHLNKLILLKKREPKLSDWNFVLIN